MKRLLVLGLVLAACSAEKSHEPQSASSPSAADSVAHASGRPATSPTSAPAAALRAVTLPAGQLEALLVRDQPTNSGLVRWDGGVAVRTNPPRRLDLGAKRSTEITVDGADSVRSLATWQDKPIALVTKGADYLLAVKDDKGFRTIELPAAIRDASPSPRPRPTPLLAAGPRWIALQLGSSIHLYDGAAWSIVSLAGVRETPATTGLYANSAAFSGETLYLAFDRGEWGGALLAVDLKTGVATNVPGPELPLRDLSFDPSGALWAVRGLAHLGLREGELRVLRDGRWAIVAASERSDPSGDVPSVVPTAFDAIAFDAAGTPLLLSGAKGVLRRADKDWEPLVSPWPEFVYVNDLELSGSTLIIATYDAGVLAVDLANARASRITL
ncbi:MAG: hypothetical protein U0271_19370 [Polyangiaceae bacterium]